MAGNPRKPTRATGPRGKIRVAGSSPSVPRVTDETTPADPVTSDAPAADETVSLDKAGRSANTGKSGNTEKFKGLFGRRPKTENVSLKKPGAESAGTQAAANTEQAGANTPTGFLTWRKVATVAAVALVIGLFAVVAAFKPGASAESNTAFINSSETSVLKSQAGDRICAVLSIDPTKFDDWANNAKAGLTGEALKEFNDYQASSKDLAAQSGQGAECKVDLVAVSNMDDSNATVVATLVISTTQQGVAVLGGPGQARTELGLQKVNGQWLISRISDF